jgi:hypothetical protein
VLDKHLVTLTDLGNESLNGVIIHTPTLPPAAPPRSLGYGLIRYRGARKLKRSPADTIAT